MPRSQALPDRRGRFGQYGGRFVPELLMSPLDELTRAYGRARKSKRFQKRLQELDGGLCDIGCAGRRILLGIERGGKTAEVMDRARAPADMGEGGAARHPMRRYAENGTGCGQRLAERNPSLLVAHDT